MGGGTKERQRRHRLGLFAELFAAFYFTLKAYRILAWRCKTPFGEIDLVLSRGRRLVFVEVKARADQARAAEAVHAKNQARVVRAAQYYLRRHPRLAAREIRFDVCLIAWYRWPHHLVHAFS